MQKESPMKGEKKNSGDIKVKAYKQTLQVAPNLGFKFLKNLNSKFPFSRKKDWELIVQILTIGTQCGFD